MAYLGDRVGTPAPGTAHMYPAYYRDTYMRGGQLVLHDDCATSRASHSPVLRARARARARLRAKAMQARAAQARFERLRPTKAWNSYSAPWPAQDPAYIRQGLGGRWVDEPPVPFGVCAGDGSELIDGLTRRLHLAVDAPPGAPVDWALSNMTTLQSPVRPNPYSHADSRGLIREAAHHNADMDHCGKRGPHISRSGIESSTNQPGFIHQLPRSRNTTRPHTAPASAASVNLVLSGKVIRSRAAFRELRQRCLANAMTRTDAKSRKIAELAASIEHARSTLCTAQGTTGVVTTRSSTCNGDST